MTDLTNIEQRAPKAFVKAALERPWVHRQRIDTFRVVPRTSVHGKYLVRFYLLNGRVFADCTELRTGQSCKSTLTRGRCCYHIAAAINHADHLLRVQAARSEQPTADAA